VVSNRDQDLVRLPLTVYPNPSSGPVTVSWSMPVAGEVSGTITDAAGKVVQALPARFYSTGNALLELSDTTLKLPAGSYQLSLHGPDFLAVKTIILQ